MPLPTAYFCPKCDQPYFIKEDEGCFLHRTNNPFKQVGDPKDMIWKGTY